MERQGTDLDAGAGRPRHRPEGHGELEQQDVIAPVGQVEKRGPTILNPVLLVARKARDRRPHLGNLGPRPSVHRKRKML